MYHSHLKANIKDTRLYINVNVFSKSTWYVKMSVTIYDQY